MHEGFIVLNFPMCSAVVVIALIGLIIVIVDGINYFQRGRLVGLALRPCWGLAIDVSLRLVRELRRCIDGSLVEQLLAVRLLGVRLSLLVTLLRLLITSLAGRLILPIALLARRKAGVAA